MIPEKELIVKLIRVLQPTAQIYLFGSRARGKYREQSDIDLAVDTGKKLTNSELEFIRRIVGAIHIPQEIDIVDVHRVSTGLYDSIMREGVKWTI